MDRVGVEERLRSAFVGAADAVHTYTTFGTRPDGDLIVWISREANSPEATGRFFERFAELLRIRLDARTGSA